jgi:hypothetical protein
VTPLQKGPYLGESLSVSPMFTLASNAVRNKACSNGIGLVDTFGDGVSGVRTEILCLS